jgi:hypothetical protein
VLIVCEGQKTEPEYFRDTAREEEVRLVEVLIDDESGSPKTLVERAVARKRAAAREAKRNRDDNFKYDEVWCVFDVDEHPKLKEAEDQAKANGIRLAISNPCFELWFVLHFQDQNAYVDRKRIQSSCRAHVSEYNKQMSYDVLRDAYAHAVSRARVLDARHDRDGAPGSNPSTWVYQLTERLRQLSRGEQLRRLRK